MVVPKLLEKDYLDPAFDSYRHKLKIAEFPGIAKGEPVQTEITFDKSKTNLLFTGNFYEKIRSPEYLISLLKLLSDSVCLHILGGIYGHFDDRLTENIREMECAGKVVFHGTVPPEEAKSIMYKADFLINIGNLVENQLPSKIFEYFSTGLPVIHFQKLQNCPCVPYLDRYGNALILSEQDSIQENSDKLVTFCRARPDRVPFERVKERFADCSVDAVAEIFLNTLQ